MKNPRKTPTAEQKEWMKKNNYTEKQMDEFWNENTETNFIIKNLSRSGHSWRDLNLSCVTTLPQRKALDMENKSRKELEEQQKVEKEARMKLEEEYYNEHFGELMVEKIDKGENLTERELSRIQEFEIESETGEHGRWTCSVESILLVCDRHFLLNWEQGLTEMQDNEFYSQPYEVEKKEETITVTRWVKK